MSRVEYLRYPDGVRSGSTRPSASGERSLDSLMSSSGNSAVSSASACPMLLRAAWRNSALRRGAGEEHQPELADPDLVTVLQQRVVDPVAVDVGPVEAADVVDPVGPVGAMELHVPAGHGDVVEEDVALRMAACAHDVGVEEVAAPGPRSTLHDEQRAPGREGVRRGRVGLVQDRAVVAVRLGRGTAEADRRGRLDRRRLERVTTLGAE